SVALRSTDLTPGVGCSGGFYSTLPRGYVCNGPTVTLEPSPGFRAVAEATTPEPGPLPYRYAISNGAPMYNRVPTRAEQARFERPFGPAGKRIPMVKALAAHEELAVDERIEPRDPIPPFLAGGAPFEGRLGLVRDKIPLGSMLAFTRAFEAEGRTWLLST